MTAAASERYRPDIDGLRAVAILLVLGFHGFPESVPGGFVGVDVFFVISGYLIGGILLASLDQGRFSLREFYSRRIKRIFPALTLVLIVGYVLGWHILLAEELKQLGRDVFASAAFVANLSLWAQSGYFDRAVETKPFLHLWSLGIEEQFYIVWPLLLHAVWRNKRAGAVVLVTVTLASLAYCMYATGADRTAAFYSPLSRCWELASGTLLFYFLRYRQAIFGDASAADRIETTQSDAPPLARHAASIAGILLIAATARLIGKSDPFPGWLATLPVAGSLLIIWAGPAAVLNRAVLMSRPFVALGLISYSTYLWHWPLLVYLRIAHGGEPPAGQRAAIIGLSLVLAALTYKLVENPIRTGPTRVKRVLAIAAALAFAGAVGLATFTFNGFPQRYPELIRKLTDVNFSIANESRGNRCFMSPEQDASKFAPECLEDKRPLVFLWGDSHAATMYPGLKAMQAKYGFGVAQYTSSACPPILGTENPPRPFCPEINAFVIEKIRTVKPDLVLLEAGWFTGSTKDFGNAYDGNLLDLTVQNLKAAGVTNIVIIGTSPFWQDSVQRILLNAWQSDPMHRTPPLRMKPGTWDAMVQYDASMRVVAARLGVEFLSVKDILCNTDGCLTRVAEDKPDIVSFDSSHLTPRAAEYVMQNAFDNGLHGKLLRPGSSAGDGAP